VVVHTTTDALLIKRTDHRDFWQSVTGSLEWGECAHQAALRELQEETGIAGIELRDTGILRSYAILPEWRKRYPPNTQRNKEHLFYCRLEKQPEICIDPAEHSELVWMGFKDAQQKAFSWSNKIALSMLTA
jgi:dATP pyrophosphohydrolase